MIIVSILFFGLCGLVIVAAICSFVDTQKNYVIPEEPTGAYLAGEHYPSTLGSPGSKTDKVGSQIFLGIFIFGMCLFLLLVLAG